LNKTDDVALSMTNIECVVCMKD